MSTRSQIHVDGTQVWIYKHSDGYPEGVLTTLMPFLSFFKQNRGMRDTEYLSAQIVREFAVEDLREIEDPEGYYAKQGMQERGHESRRLLGWGIGTDGPHGDEDFVYVVTSTHVDVYQREGKIGEFPIGWKQAESHEIK